MKLERKKATVDAVSARDAIHFASKNWKGLPEWLSQAYDRGRVVFCHDKISIRNGSELVMANYADWLIHNIDGVITPITQEVFEKEYEPTKTD